VGIQLIGELDDTHKHIQRRQADNLPNHVKGQAYFESHPRLRGRANPDTGYYISAGTDKLAVEFVTANGEDNWTQLGKETDGTWYTTKEALVPKENRLLGWWNTDDSQHPDFFIHHPEHTPAPPEETLAGGLHHIATLQGANPFTPQTPILPQIETAATQGIAIPINIAPIASTLPVASTSAPVIVASSGPNTLTYIPPTMSGQTGGSGPGAGGTASIAATTGGTGQTVTVAAVSSNGRLKGTPPPYFSGDRDTSHNFLVNFGIFKFTNRNNDAMSNPATRVTTALTYMGGVLVDPWKEQQMTELQACIAGGTADTEEVHWTTFEQVFKDTFYNTNIKVEAYQKLENLKMKDNLDVFISEFKRYVTASGIDINSHGIIHLFKKELAASLTTAIINSQGYDPRNPWATFQPWEDAARTCNLRWKHTQEFKTNLRQRYYAALNQKPCGPQPRGGGGQHLTTSQGGHHMDIDTTIATNITGRGPELSEAKKAELQANNSCFYCFKRGHCARDCRKKQADHAQSSRSTANTSNQTRTREITINDITPKLVNEMIRSDAFQAMDEEFKLSFLEDAILGNTSSGF